MDMQTTGWDKMGDLTAGGPDQTQPGDAPFYLSPAVAPKIAAVAQANNIHPDQLVSNVKQSIASGKSTPQQAEKELDQHYDKASSPNLKMGTPDVSQEMPPGQDWLKVLATYSDSLNGGHLANSIQAPASSADIATYQNKLGGAQQELLGRDPNSQISKNARASTAAALQSSLPGIDVKKVLPESMSANDIENNSQIKAMLAGGYSVQGNQLKAAAMGAKNDTFNAKNATQVSKDYEKHMEEPISVQNSIKRIESVLTTPIISKQQLGDVNMAISNIFSPKHQSDATVSKTEYDSMSAKAAGALQTLFSKPQDIGARELIKHILDQAYHIGNVTNQAAKKEIEGLDAGYATEPSLAKMAQAKSEFFNKRFGQDYGATSATVNVVSPVDGKVHAIPKEKLQDALSAGGKVQGG